MRRKDVYDWTAERVLTRWLDDHTNDHQSLIDMMAEEFRGTASQALPLEPYAQIMTIRAIAIGAARG